MKRYNPNVKFGLTTKQVNCRIKENLINYDSTIKTKSIIRIIVENSFTLFNLLNFILALFVMLVGSYKNLLFIGIVMCNSVISIIQAIRSKIIVDKLSIINSNKTTVIRNGKLEEIKIDEIVIDDIILLKPGNQIVVDSIVMEGNIQINESFITGESDLVNYTINDTLKSGSFVVSGRATVKVEHIGKDNYTSLITIESKYIKKINSILLSSLNKIIKIVSFAIIPMGILLFLNQYNLSNNTISSAVLNTVAALIGMIPEGLILLTSTVLAVSTIRLAKWNVLVQELYCIEMLARVNTICLDKTGTITTGKMKVEKVINLNKEFENIMSNIINYMEEDNTTSEALKNYFKPNDNLKYIKSEPFSPINKYASYNFKEGVFLIGAPDIIYHKNLKEVEDNLNNRVLLVTKDNEPVGVIVLRDEIRKSSKKTLEYLIEQGVNIKIISGDNVKTVSSLMHSLNINNLKAIDVSDITITKDIVNEYSIFGRVKPEQKKLMVTLLQESGQVVAMTGDGVNDVLALKQADCSITIKNATDAARNVSQLVLLDNTFDSIPKIIKEGRRSINNIERSATLFLAKTAYAFLLAFTFMFVNFNYPFEPIQLTLTNFFTIGIPSFILALEPNDDVIKGNFLINVFSKSLPTALTIVINILVIITLGNMFKLANNEISTLCVIMTGFTGFLLLIKLSFPFNKLRLCLIIVLVAGFIFSCVGFNNLFSLTLLTPHMFILIIFLVTISLFMFNLMDKLIDKLIVKYPKVFGGTI